MKVLTIALAATLLLTAAPRAKADDLAALAAELQAMMSSGRFSDAALDMIAQLVVWNARRQQGEAVPVPDLPSPAPGQADITITTQQTRLVSSDTIVTDLAPVSDRASQGGEGGGGTTDRGGSSVQSRRATVPPPDEAPDQGGAGGGFTTPAVPDPPATLNQASASPSASAAASQALSPPGGPGGVAERPGAVPSAANATPQTQLASTSPGQPALSAQSQAMLDRAMEATRLYRDASGLAEGAGGILGAMPAMTLQPARAAAGFATGQIPTEPLQTQANRGTGAIEEALAPVLTHALAEIERAKGNW